ncbi:hypothetical protein Rhe02_81170 [Rhizocola hellebori]|uniref:PKD domain-containing protein n=2 Tax=Rhizocola hellebori TaxID=1392758 RepID=A0A8J3QFR3_9ACTN|nr:hypothetical protein Rhe02_81170 [Rhizocola hellebori]
MALGAVGVLALAVAPVAHADDWGQVNCSKDQADSRCTVVVVYIGVGNGNTSGGGRLECTIGGVVVECSNGFGWLGSDGCYYGKDPQGFLPPNEWIKTCIDPATDVVTRWGVVYLPRPPVALDSVTQRAVAAMTIPKPVIAASPSLSAPQMVHVPVWWWAEPGFWQSQTATATAGSLSITAQATPRSITWHAGDGTTTVCIGPGTPWTAGTEPNTPSPDCGHTYTATSKLSPGGTFTLQAVATWDITWTGGGMSGVLPPITTTTTIDITVTELRAVITG